ncbi:hypothetical protein AV530_011184 [Patagioenas fasciata monilis]|uniref:Uncharacterized protein n=1 Tax=Patagioenas fasciata monilis TaxID=372326 RepID=A0A1V4KRY6_PATFA|nr:hypothetical protein AV530_011184 [Patagioenas fasciata monilis]
MLFLIPTRVLFSSPAATGTTSLCVQAADGELVQYHYGPKDLVTILFYIFIAIILHAVVQEYALDKINRRLHLSKVKHSKFNESGQLVAFHLTSMVWCLYVVVTVRNGAGWLFGFST